MRTRVRGCAHTGLRNKGLGRLGSPGSFEEMEMEMVACWSEVQQVPHGQGMRGPSQRSGTQLAAGAQGAGAGSRAISHWRGRRTPT